MVYSWGASERLQLKAKLFSQHSQQQKARESLVLRGEVSSDAWLEPQDLGAERAFLTLTGNRAAPLTGPARLSRLKGSEKQLSL